MTATQPANPVCPECGGTNTMVLSDGMARCFDDQHEWDPDKVSGFPRPQAAPAPATEAPVAEGIAADSPATGDVGTAGDVVDPHSFDVTAAPATEPSTATPAGDVFPARTPVGADNLGLTVDEMIGGTARLEGGQVAMVLSFPDPDHVVVRLNDGRDETVPLSDVERITPRAPEVVIDVPADDRITLTPAEVDGPDFPFGAEHPDEAPVAEWIGDVQALSNLMLKAGVASVYETPDALVVGEPPKEWLPRDESSNALVEAAVAISIARLIVAYEIDVDDLLEGLGETADTQQGDQQEVTHQ